MEALTNVDYGIVGFAISVLAYLLFFVIKKSSEREKKLMEFIFKMQPVQDSILASIKDIDRRVEIIEKKVSKKNGW